MKVIADICIIPLGVGLSLSRYIAVCEEIIQKHGLKSHLHAYGTNVEGDWDEVMDVLKKCHQALHDMGAPRVSTSLRLGTRTDREQSMEDKVSSVAGKIRGGN